MGNRLRRCVTCPEEIEEAKWREFQTRQPDLARKLAHNLDRCRTCLQNRKTMENELEEIWSLLRYNLRAVSQCEGLDDVPDKRMVWCFLLEVGTRRRTRKSQVKEIGDMLFQSSAWAAALTSDVELCRGMSSNELLSKLPRCMCLRSLLPHTAPTPVIPGTASPGGVIRGAGLQIAGAPPTSLAPVSATAGPDRSVALTVSGSTPQRVPTTWTTPSGVHLLSDPDRKADVQKLMTDSWKVKYTRDRRRREVPSGCCVEEVLRVENHGSYAKYCNYKREILTKLAGSGNKFSAITGQSLGKLEQDANEIYVFHGTSPQSASDIAKNGFCMKRAGSSTGCMFGPGFYFGENASKSDEYTKELLCGELCAMLVCRVVAGRVLTVTAPGDYSHQFQDGRYDSLCGDRLAAAGTFREIVLFQADGIYIEYIALYRRVYE